MEPTQDLLAAQMEKYPTLALDQLKLSLEPTTSVLPSAPMIPVLPTAPITSLWPFTNPLFGLTPQAVLANVPVTNPLLLANGLSPKDNTWSPIQSTQHDSSSRLLGPFTAWPAQQYFAQLLANAFASQLSAEVPASSPSGSMESMSTVSSPSPPNYRQLNTMIDPNMMDFEASLYGQRQALYNQGQGLAPSILTTPRSYQFSLSPFQSALTNFANPFVQQPQQSLPSSIGAEIVRNRNNLPLDVQPAFDILMNGATQNQAGQNRSNQQTIVMPTGRRAEPRTKKGAEQYPKRGNHIGRIDVYMTQESPTRINPSKVIGTKEDTFKTIQIFATIRVHYRLTQQFISTTSGIPGRSVSTFLRYAEEEFKQELDWYMIQHNIEKLAIWTYRFWNNTSYLDGVNKVNGEIVFHGNHTIKTPRKSKLKKLFNVAAIEEQFRKMEDFQFQLGQYDNQETTNLVIKMNRFKF